jgi:O-antigen/teichoic acid export membrane protein
MLIASGGLLIYNRLVNLSVFIKKTYLHFKNDSLYRNSIYLMMSTVILAVSGFFFWIIAARLFKTEQVGIATTLISVTTLIGSFALLGLNFSLVRFLPKSEKKNEMISSSFILVTIASFLAITFFLLGIKVFSPELSFIRSNVLYLIIFVLFIVMTAVTNIIDSVFLAFRSSENILIRNTVQSILKVLLVFAFVGLGAFGIFNSFALSLLGSAVVSFYILFKKFHFSPVFKVDSGLVKKMGSYSIGNYISGFLYQAPFLILPILVINSLHAKIAAYYYIDTMILSLILVIPVSASQSLFTEGSHSEEFLHEHLKKAAKFTVLLLIPSIIIILLFGGFVLQIFGKSYQTDSFRFLQIISLSAIFMSVALFGNAILRIRKKVTTLVILNLIGCVIVLLTSYLFINSLIGVGFGWLVGEIIVAGIYLIYFFKSK